MPRTLDLDEPFLPPGSSGTADALPAAVPVILRAAAQAADLTTLELRIAGRVGQAHAVQRQLAPAVRELAVWQTSVQAGPWHDGFLLVATAPRVDERCRAAVQDAAAVIDTLLTSERRREQAEQLASRAIELAGLDPLTKLGNRRTWRRALHEEGARAARYVRDTGVAIIDLDGLKHINDSQGHAAGDVHLLRASQAVLAACRSVDVVCRLGGDEFAVLAPETGLVGVQQLAVRVQAELDRAGVAASIGIATSDTGDLETAWQEADVRMYEHKRRRRAHSSPGRQRHADAG